MVSSISTVFSALPLAREEGVVKSRDDVIRDYATQLGRGILSQLYMLIQTKISRSCVVITLEGQPYLVNIKKVAMRLGIQPSVVSHAVKNNLLPELIFSIKTERSLESSLDYGKMSRSLDKQVGLSALLQERSAERAAVIALLEKIDFDQPLSLPEGMEIAHFHYDHNLKQEKEKGPKIDGRSYSSIFERDNEVYSAKKGDVTVARCGKKEIINTVNKNELNNNFTNLVNYYKDSLKEDEFDFLQAIVHQGTLEANAMAVAVIDPQLSLEGKSPISMNYSDGKQFVLQYERDETGEIQQVNVEAGSLCRLQTPTDGEGTAIIEHYNFRVVTNYTVTLKEEGLFHFHYLGTKFVRDPTIARLKK